LILNVARPNFSDRAIREIARHLARLANEDARLPDQNA
jgi:hypothetical protein